MKTKNIIKELKRFNKWRRGLEIEMPEPKELGHTINEAVDRLKQYEEMINSMKQFNNNLKKQVEQNDDYFKTAIGEIQFNSLQKQHYQSILDEVEVLLNNNIKSSLIKKVIENGKARATLDVSIHYNENNEIK